MILFPRDIIRRVAKETRLSQRVVSDVVGQYAKEVKHALSDGHEVRHIGFGTFYTRERKERIGLNFRSKKQVKIPAGRTAVFRFADTIRRAANKVTKKKRKLFS